MNILPSIEAQHKNCLKTFYPASYARAKEEVPIEKEFGPKNRIRNLSNMRNGYPVSAPGDKSYKNPEYSINFFLEGGLIPGSTNIYKYNKTVSKKNHFFYETMNLDYKSLDPKKLWKNKEKQELTEYDSNYVKMLSIWDKTVGNEIIVPSLPVEIVTKKTANAPANKILAKK